MTKDTKNPINNPDDKLSTPRAYFYDKCPECKGELQYNAFWGYSYCPICKWCDWGGNQENKKY